MATVLKGDRFRKENIGEAEWKVRVDLAAFYRLSAGWDNLIYTHISARVPGPYHHFLINPFGLMFDEITASSLVKVDLDGNVIGESEYGINYAGYVIHSAIHAARDDAHSSPISTVRTARRSPPRPKDCCRSTRARSRSSRADPTMTMKALRSTWLSASGWSPI